MQFPFTISDKSIAVFVNGTMYNIDNTHNGYAKLAEHLKQGEHDAETIETLADKKKFIELLSEGAVKVVGSTVYYKGSAVHSTLSNKLVSLLEAGYNAKPWARFLDKVMQNPSETSRKCLFDFLDRFDAPLTEDGNFLAFKGVRDDYLDVHTGTMDNSPGKVVSMPRDQVVEDPNQTCASGLHACASKYLDGFWSGHKVIVVSINPKDVVSVPADYDYSKMRVCEYYVIGDAVDERSVETLNKAKMYVDNTYIEDEDEEDDVHSEWDDYSDPFVAADEGDEDDIVSFYHAATGKSYDAEDILKGVADLGQREYSRQTGIPRTTLQGWLNMLADV